MNSVFQNKMQTYQHSLNCEKLDRS